MRFVESKKASLVKGRWPSVSEVGGIRREMYVFASVFGEFVTWCCESPSHGFAVPAPFDKGAIEGCLL